MYIFTKLFVSLLIILAVLALPEISDAQARTQRVCIDNVNDRVVTKRRCKAPRFTEVLTRDILNTGVQGISDIETVSKSVEVFLVSSTDISGNSVSCPAGKVVTGGGASIIDNNGLRIRRSIPSGASGWTAAVEATKAFSSGELSIYAICVFDGSASE